MKFVLHVGENDQMCPVSPSGPRKVQEAGLSHPGDCHSGSANTQQTHKCMSIVNISLCKSWAWGLQEVTNILVGLGFIPRPRGPSISKTHMLYSLPCGLRAGNCRGYQPSESQTGQGGGGTPEFCPCHPCITPTSSTSICLTLVCSVLLHSKNVFCCFNYV